MEYLIFGGIIHLFYTESYYLLSSNISSPREPRSVTLVAAVGYNSYVDYCIPRTIYVVSSSKSFVFGTTVNICGQNVSLGKCFKTD
jgi:hypothetical protein